MPRGLTLGLLYPAPYRAALSSIAYHLIRGLYRSLGIGVWEAFLENGGPWFPSGRPPRRLGEALMISLPYELLYPDAVSMLAAIGVPPRRASRGIDDPIIIAGGPAVTGNPLPVAGIVDAVLIGELEPVAADIVDALGYPSRKARLEALASVEGVYVPGVSETPVRRVYARDLDAAWYPVVQEAPRDVEPVWGRAFMLEASRGCARGCRFCLEGFIFRPKRDRSYTRMARLVDEGVQVNRVGKVSFISLSFFDNPHAERILEHVVEGLGLEASVPSLRVDTLTDRRIELIAKGGQRTLTIAPETGSCRVAAAIRKDIGRDVVVDSVATAVEKGIRNVKLYIMTGFPGEREEDFNATLELVEEAAAAAARGGGRVRVSINPFIPKPATPLQWAPAPDPATIKARLASARKRLARKGVEVGSYDPKLAQVQTVLSRGGPELSDAIVEWAMRGGKPSQLKKIMERRGLSFNSYLDGVGEVPPWHEVVEHPFAPLKLLRLEYRAFLSAMNAGCRR